MTISHSPAVVSTTTCLYVHIHVIGSEKIFHVQKLFFIFIYDCYKTAYVLHMALYLIMIERLRSEVTYFFICYVEENLRKSCLKYKFRLQKKYSVFLCKSVLCKYIIISLQCVAYACR